MPRLLRSLLLAGSAAWAFSSPSNAADCSQADPRKFDDVLSCMMSVERGQKRVFEHTGGTDCRTAVAHYSHALRRSGIPNSQVASRLPSCALLARGIEQIRGTREGWAGCTAYPNRFDAGHMKSCLEGFLPSYYRTGRRLDALGGCADATREYELALKSATPDRGLPAGYEKPDCTAVASLTGGKGLECLDYQPGTDHLQKCLGAASTRYTQCPALRNAYEQKLRQAYGGGLPPSYAPMTCDEAAPITSAAVTQAETRKTEVRKEQQQARAETAQIRAANASKSSWEWWTTGLVTRVTVTAFILHMAIYLSNIFYERQKVLRSTGADIRVPLTVAGISSKQTQFFQAVISLSLIGFGILLTDMTWMIGTVAAWIVWFIIATRMLRQGKFTNLPQGVDVTGPDGVPIKPHIADVPVSDPGRKKGGWG